MDNSTMKADRIKGNRDGNHLDGGDLPSTAEFN